MTLTQEQLHAIACASVAAATAAESMTPGLRVLCEIHRRIDSGEIPMIPQLTTVAETARAAVEFLRVVRNALDLCDAKRNGGVH